MTAHEFATLTRATEAMAAAPVPITGPRPALAILRSAMTAGQRDARPILEAANIDTIDDQLVRAAAGFPVPDNSGHREALWAMHHVLDHWRQVRRRR